MTCFGWRGVAEHGSPRRGTVDRTRVDHVRQHELDTAQRLADLGDDVTLVPAPGTDRVADIGMNGARWELKSPVSTNPNTIGTRLGRGAGQSSRIVFDVARTPINVADAERIARGALDRYPGISVISLIGRHTLGGPLDLTIGR